jgi:hypothetical protein
VINAAFLMFYEDIEPEDLFLISYLLLIQTAHIFTTWFHASAAKHLRSALVWDIMQCTVVIPYGRNYHYMLCNIPGEHRSAYILMINH